MSDIGLRWVGSILDWMIGGSLGVVLSTFWSYRVLTRRFDWGPNDT
jgi:hypothetical protein